MDPLLETALRAADAAAAVHVHWAGRLGVAGAVSKGRGDFVSRADIEAQAAVFDVIRAAFPEHRILAEEDTPAGAPPGGDGEPLWIVDPLDGTANFLHGHPVYAASVGVAVDGVVAAGAISCATTGERWWARRGAGAWKSGRPIAVSDARTLEGGLIGTGFPFKAQHLIPEYLEELGHVLRAGAGVRRAGAAALDLCYVAEGRLDGFWESFLNPWDFAAGIVIVEEAGGVLAGDDGGTLRLDPGPVLAANSPELMEVLLGTLRVRDRPE